MSVKEIEAAITQLPTNDIKELKAWITEYDAHRWDEQIADDLEAGRLDWLLAEVEQEYQAGLARPL